MLSLFAASEAEINQWLEQNPLVLGGIALLIGLVLLGFGVKALLTGVSHSKWGTEFNGPMAHLHGIILTGFGGLVILFALYKIVVGLLGRGAPVIVFVLALAGLSRLALTADPPGPHVVDVLCVDEEGKPIAGAEVHLFQQASLQEGHPYNHVGPLKSDAAGQVQFPEAEFTTSLGDFDRWIYARIPGKLVGAARSVRWKTQKEIINPSARVRLFPSSSVAGTVTVPKDADPSSVKVNVRTMHIKSGEGDWDFESFPREASFRGLDTALPEIFETRPDKMGRFELHDVPERGRLYLVTSAPGLGEAQWSNDWRTQAFDKPMNIEIEKERKLLGRVVSPQNEPVAGVKVRARIGNKFAKSYQSTFVATTNDEGQFEMVGLPAETQFTVSLTAPQDKWAFRPVEAVFGFLDPTQALTLKLEEAIVVAGEVLDTHGKPVEGAALSALADSPERPGLDDAQTDSQGRFRLTLPAGATELYFNALPDGFKYPDPQVVKTLKLAPGQAAITDLVITLERQTKDSQ